MELRLRELRDADLDAVFAWESDPAGIGLAAFTRSDPNDRDAFDEHYRKIGAEPSNLIRVIEAEGEPVGTISSFWIDDDREISYWIARAWWGQGIASRALGLFLAEETTRPLRGRVAETNPASRAVLRKNGFEEVGQDTGYAAGVGRVVTEYLYRLDAR
ncbi:GNAT family N-acetyltransferase [Arthrobacter woluwensis]|uniref:GNAT family N-acetyltransferase n=1 Tax=Arthrobacter woluwensis TaxID=156980 RepID=UPI0015E67FED|nr:GNAT family N-acetyltransferase [Arthrobacter woluwensis]